jgi:hypothetical protein
VEMTYAHYTLNLTLFLKNGGGKYEAPNNLIIEALFPSNVYPKCLCWLS